MSRGVRWDCLRHEHLSQKPLAGRAAPAALSSCLPSPAMWGTYCPEKQYGFGFFCPSTSTMFSLTFFLMNVLRFLSEISQC